ncbi:MAG TPA: HPr family phosphocarrier protein [Syntrophorhabdaceae bacterium]|nr:HPr family phosphocarrier protein [Syntrophorhabdaceae bacterium]
MLEGIFTVKNRLGLHARAAATFVKMANDFKANVWMEKDGMQVNGKSIMGLLMLACPLGSKVIIRTDGPDEKRALDDLGQLINNGFNEE